MKIHLATTNPGKVKEFRAALEGRDIELLPTKLDIPELDTNDMVEVSKDKARQAFLQLKAPVLVDDAGIYIEKYGDFPGTKTKDIGIEGVLPKISEGDRAYFQSVVTYMDEQLSEPVSFVGKVEGILSLKDSTPSTEREAGLPFNHLFIPEGKDQFMYQIPLSERMSFNHRAKALLGFRKFYDEHLREREQEPEYRNDLR